mmetsp:Transcript_43755/g.109197  ORF Transcript_43755/g.109197 Transcript_43755/m.109197 type:complete len:221 (+) Transcript_43755:263-925(+)
MHKNAKAERHKTRKDKTRQDKTGQNRSELCVSIYNDFVQVSISDVTAVIQTDRQTDRRPSYYAHTGMYAGVCVCREGAPRPVHEPTGPSSPAVQCACVFHVDESDLDVPLGLAQPMHTRRHYHPAYLSDPHAEDGLPLPGEIQVTHHHRPALLVDHLVALEVVVPDGVVDLDGLVEVEREGPLAHLHYLEAHTQHRCLRLSDEGQIVLVSRGQLVGDRRR